MTDALHKWRQVRKGAALYGAALFLLALYVYTAQRGVSWQDSGEFQYRVLAGDYSWYSGIARAHPLYIGLARAFAWLFPSATRVLAVTWFSGLGSAVALAFLIATVWRLTGSRWGAVLAAVTLGLSHMVWWMSTVAEVYTWSLAFLMAELYCLARFWEGRRACWLIALFGVNGAHAAIHNFAFLDLPLYGVLALSEWRVLFHASNEPSQARWLRVAGFTLCVVCAWLAGAGALVWQVLAGFAHGGGFIGTLTSLLFGDGYECAVLGTGSPHWRQVAGNLGLAGLSVLNPCWFLAWRGWAGLAHRHAFRTCLAGLTALHVLFWVRYFVPDQATFVLPTLGLLAVWLGASWGKLSSENGRGRGRRLVALMAGVACGVAVPVFVCQFSRQAGVTVARNRTLPFRDEIRYWVMPWKQGEHSAARFVAEVGKTLREGDVLVADSTSAGALMAAREAGILSRDWRLVTPWSGETDDQLHALCRGGPGRLFVVSPVAGYAPRAVLATTAGFEQAGVLFRAACSP